jgi:uncharacterized protein YbjT (DUF2867 family)
VVGSRAVIETAHRAFVVGATGLTGRHVVSTLRECGIETIAHVRPDSRSVDTWRARFAELGAETDTTPWDQDAMTSTLRDRAVTMIFALLGTTRKREQSAKAKGSDPELESYEAVDYGLTALVRRAAEASGHAPRFVYLSAAGVTDETSRPYYVARAKIERELRKGTLPYTIVRPSFILGDRDEARMGESIGASVTDAMLSAAGLFGARKLRDRYRSIRAEELARAIVRLAMDDEAENRVIHAEELR